MNEKKNVTFELKEPVSPEALVPDSLVEPWMIWGATLILLLFVCLAVLALRRKAAAPPNPQSLRQTAFNEAVAALAKIAAAVPTREAAVRCSLILRKYLATAAAEPALFETHEETISRHEALKGFSPEARMTTQAGFGRLAALKYAPEIPDIPASNVVSESSALLKTLHQGFLA